MNTTETKPERWTATYHESGNDIQNGLAGYSVQFNDGSLASRGIAYNISKESDAKLIAAAPELLAALEGLMPLNEDESRYEAYKDEFDTAEEAIAKAKP